MGILGPPTGPHADTSLSLSKPKPKPKPNQPTFLRPIHPPPMWEKKKKKKKRVGEGLIKEAEEGEGNQTPLSISERERAEQTWRTIKKN